MAAPTLLVRGPHSEPQVQAAVFPGSPRSILPGTRGACAPEGSRMQGPRTLCAEAGWPFLTGTVRPSRGKRSQIQML